MNSVSVTRSTRTIVRGNVLVAFMRTYGIALVLLILIAAVTAGNSRFLTGGNLANLLSQWAPAGVIAIGMTLIILTGGFDLSVASGYALCAVIAVALGRSLTPDIAFTAAIGVGLAIGVLNGVLVAGLGINPFITTVGTGFILGGVAVLVAGTEALIVSNPGFGDFGKGSVAGVPYVGIVLIVGLLLGGFILSRTVYGQWIYGVGGNREATRLAGVRVRIVTGSTYVITGVCVGIAGVMSASELSTANANLDPGIVFNVLTVVVVGGTSLAGGFGGMWRTAVGLALLATVTNGMNLLDINIYYQDIVKGIIIVGALALDGISSRLATLVRAWRE